MELRKGYKQTEVGMIPEDWIAASIGSFASFQSGEGINVSALSTESPDTPIPVFGGNGIAGYTDRTLLHKPSVVVGRVGQKCGETYLTTGAAWVTDNALYPRSLADHVSTPFLAYALKGAGLNDVRNRNDLPLVTQSILHSFTIPLPTLTEQEVIAEALSDTDSLIKFLEQHITKKRQIKQGAMQELLTGKKRLPGFGGEWEVKTLLQIAEGKKELFDDGDWIESEHITSSGVRLIQTGNIGIGVFVEKEEKKYIYEKSFISLRCKELRKGDLLVCRLAEPAGRACIFPDIGEARVVTSVDVTIYRPPPKSANRVFLANLFSTLDWFRTVGDRSGGTTHKRISRGALGRITVNLPPLAEQTAIAKILSNMDTEITALQTKLTKSRQIKQGMMQELLTGKTRLI